MIFLFKIYPKYYPLTILSPFKNLSKIREVKKYG